VADPAAPEPKKGTCTLFYDGVCTKEVELNTNSYAKSAFREPPVTTAGKCTHRFYHNYYEPLEVVRCKEHTTIQTCTMDGYCYFPKFAAGSSCGGDNKGDEVDVPMTTPSLQACKDICTTKGTYCEEFAFDKTNNKCFIYTGKCAEAASEDQTVYYKDQCCYWTTAPLSWETSRCGLPLAGPATSTAIAPINKHDKVLHEECNAACHEDDGCQYFDMKDGVCTLYDAGTMNIKN
jgi:hypothetical protein